MFGDDLMPMSWEMIKSNTVIMPILKHYTFTFVCQSLGASTERRSCRRFRGWVRHLERRSCRRLWMGTVIAFAVFITVPWIGTLCPEAN